MATAGTFAFVEALKEPTLNHIIRWEMANVNPNTFNCQLNINDNGKVMNVNVILDKYKTIDNSGVESICINFAIIENNDEQKVKTNIVRCNNNEDHYLEEYHLLNDLYNKVESNTKYFDISIDASMAF